MVRLKGSPEAERKVKSIEAGKELEESSEQGMPNVPGMARLGWIEGEMREYIAWRRRATD
jgi:hypothetical protein